MVAVDEGGWVLRADVGVDVWCWRGKLRLVYIMCLMGGEATCAAFLGVHLPVGLTFFF